MANLTSFRVVVSGQEKEIFHVLEKKNEGLTIKPRRGVYNAYREDAVSPTNNPYQESRISIHPTLDNPDGNLFHRTLVTRDIRRDTYIWTEAIKKKTGFCPVFFQICSRMEAAGYEPKPNSSRSVNLGSFDREIFTLYYGLFVSAPERTFSYPHTCQVRWINTDHRDAANVQYRFGEPLDFYTIDAVFKRFRLTLIVSYLGAPNPVGPHFFHHDTIDPADTSISPADLPYHQDIIKGRNESACILDFQFVRSKLLAKYLEAANMQPDQPVAKVLRFFAHPTRQSSDGVAYYRRLQLTNL